MKVKGSLYWIYSFTSGCKGKMLVAILLAVIGVLCGMAPYFALAGILSGLIQNTLTAEHIFCYVGIAVLGETLKMLFNTVSSLKAHRVAYHILGNIRCKLAEKMMRVPMGVMVDTPSGKLKAMVVDTVDKLEQPLAHMLPEITANVFTPLCIIILLFILDWRMALACMIVIPIGFLLLMGQMKDYKNRSDRYIEASSNMDSSLVEYVNGIEVIKTFSQTGKSFQKFSDAVKNYHDTTLDWWKNTWLYSALGLTVIPATLVGGIPVGAYLLMQGSISFSIYITCLILSLGIAGPLIQATYYADNFAIVDASIRQVGNFLDEQELVRPSKEVLLTDDGFHFEHVSFRYDKKEVLHDITFSPVPEGKTAIVGPSGSGKSTITKLMAGFWDVTSGHIIYGGQDIRNIPTSQLMKHISFVSQDNFLFNISIKENIRMGNPCATDEEVLAAAKAARCDEFISKMEYGYDTLVGDAGGKLSGGERQRITIARAILKPADVVILDEASAYADPENEVYIEEAINELVKDKTLIVVAHRLETIENSDKIVVVDQGKIVAEGTQSELLKNCALYKRLWNETILTSERKRGDCNA